MGYLETAKDFYAAAAETPDAGLCCTTTPKWTLPELVVPKRMDAMNYGVDGNWPSGADGSGVSLAKKNPNLASRPAANWSASVQTGGTPGTANFTTAPITGAQNEVIPLTAQWRYDDSGTDLGTAWRAPEYDDSAWASGPALFFAGKRVGASAAKHAADVGPQHLLFPSDFYRYE